MPYPGKLPPHRRAHSTSHGACPSADYGARRAGDEKTSSASEACTCYGRAAGQYQRCNDSEYQPMHMGFPQRELSVGNC
jgi:hypothetical protein